MTEIELSMALGILPDPDKNRVPNHPMVVADMVYLRHVFQIASQQKRAIGTVNQEIWCEFLPWHSMN